MDTHRLQKLDIDYTVYIKDYKSQTYTLQSLLIDYKNQIICLGHPSEEFIVFTLALQKSVVSAFSIKSLYCALFETTKVCSVRFFITKFVVHASSFQSCPVLPFHYKVCCIRFFRLQKLVVCAF
jgi:hypothetical protein